MRNVSTHQVLYAAFQLANKAINGRLLPDVSFLMPNAVQPWSIHIHPWLIPDERALPGKLTQMRAIVGLYAHLEGAARGLQKPLIFPFMMQPVLETALSIPSWRSSAGGRDRAVARTAFAELPEMVRLRRSKGTFDGLTFGLFHHHRARLEEMLLDGYLANRGLINRDAIATYFRRGTIPSGRELNRLLALADCNAWASATLAARHAY
jgi:asparagine synthase (glutamine-hydrolysing)